MNNQPKKLIRFDWAIKYLLRDKANFDILEGFLGALLEDEDLQIIELLGEEGNQMEESEKFNRVDLMVKDGQGRRIIIEVQTTREVDYLERLLFGTSKSIIEHVGTGNDYKNIHKVISVSVLFFNLGLGDDYLYHGKTTFIGMNDGKPLLTKRKEEKLIDGQAALKFKDKNIFPEYYLIRVEKYQNIIKKKIDEWIYLIKNNEVKEGSKAKHIDKAEAKLDFLNMNPEERAKYQRYLINLAREKDILDTARAEGEKKGKIIGMEKGESLKSFTTLMNLLMELPDVPNASKSIITGIPLEKIVQLEKILQLPDFTGILADVLSLFFDNIDLDQKELGLVKGLVSQYKNR